MALLPDNVYVPTVGRYILHRRVIGVLQGRVVYCVGADRNFSCQVESMKRWIRRSKAELVHGTKQ